MTSSNGRAAANAQYNLMTPMNHEILRITNGQPHLYSLDQIAKIREQIALEFRERAELELKEIYKSKKRYYAGSGLFLLIAFVSILVQSIADIMNDPNCDKVSGFM